MGMRLEEKKTPEGIKELFGVTKEFTIEDKIKVMKKYPFTYEHGAAEDIPELKEVYQALLATLTDEEKAEVEAKKQPRPILPPELAASLGVAGAAAAAVGASGAAASAASGTKTIVV